MKIIGNYDNYIVRIEPSNSNLEYKVSKVINDKSKEENKDKCMWYKSSRHKLKPEVKKYDPDGYKGYEQMGCYECNGLNDLCDHYIIKRNY